MLKDELKLSEPGKAKVNAPRWLFQIISTLFYSYVFSIPFPLGGTSQPGPIVYAKHYAETFSQMILQSDNNLNDLKVTRNLAARPQVITRLIPLPDIVNGNGNGNGNGHGNGNGNGNGNGGDKGGQESG